MSPIPDDRFSRSKEVYTGESETLKAEIIKPLALAGAGILIIAAYLLMFGGSIAGVAVGLPAVILAVAIQVVLGIVALIIAVAVLRSGAGPLGLAVLRLFGIFMFVQAVGIPLGALGCVGLIMSLLVLGGLIAWLFDLDGTEAAVVVLVLIAVRIAAFFLLQALTGDF